MNKRDSLIAAAARIQETISHIDLLLESLGAIEDSIVDSGAIAPEPILSATAVAEPPPAAIAYMDEAKKFISEWSKHRSFQISDFSRFLAKKFGPENVNDQSMRGPMPRLVDAGLIYVYRKGGGKVPNLYMLVSDQPRKLYRASSPAVLPEGYINDPAKGAYTPPVAQNPNDADAGSYDDL